MAKWLYTAGMGLSAGMMRAGLLLAAWVALPHSPLALAQHALAVASEPSHPVRPRMLAGRLPEKPTLPPAFNISVGPLGFSAPGAYYLGQRTSMVSLDFLDEDRLLFTFRVPGLIHRETGDENERQIRAVLLKLPEGTVQAEALWSVHDRARYLWMLKDGHFLLRDGRDLQVGDAALELKPYLRFPGALLWIDADATQEFLVADSREPAAPSSTSHHTSDQAPSLHSGGQPSSGEDRASLGLGSLAGTEAAKPEEEQPPASQPDLAVRILRRSSGEVILVSRTRTAIHLPVNADGYLESLRARGNEWLLNLKSFSGGSAILGRVDSACPPLFDFLSQREVLVTGCTVSGAGNLTAIRTDGQHLWEALSADTTVWPLIVRAPDGSRLARETLVVPSPIGARAPLDPADIKGQQVIVLDAAYGNVALETTASPALDAGGNVAISPSGRRVAVLNGGQIQVFELPLAPPIPEATVPAHTVPAPSR
jgi:hypothetical protein